MSWRFQSWRHSLAAKGVKTSMMSSRAAAKRTGIYWDVSGKRIEWMSPDEYLRRTGLTKEDESRPQFEIFSKVNEDNRHIETRPIDELAPIMESKKIAPPFVKTDRPIDSLNIHEGRHRAIVARDFLNQKEIPVQELNVPQGWRSHDVFEEFMKERFGGYDATPMSNYNREWWKRFEEGDPESHMDSQSRAVYYKILRERGLLKSKAKIDPRGSEPDLVEVPQ